jgi:hypothetical protein
MAQASQEAAAGRYAVADKLLADFTTRYPASGEGAESMFWRAVFRMDPSNPNASTHDASVLLENYLANPSAPRRGEATTLRRVINALEAKPSAVQSATPAKTSADPAPDKAKDDEIARLKDELAKANAELERIKKRLAQPTKP